MHTNEIVDIKAFLPSKDYAVSIRFYEELGFTVNFSNAEITEFQMGNSRFLLTPYYVKEFAENLMMQLVVSNVDSWWEHAQSSQLAQRYPDIMCKAPAVQPWGLKVMYLSDPGGVLWHITETPGTS